MTKIVTDPHSQRHGNPTSMLNQFHSARRATETIYVVQSGTAESIERPSLRVIGETDSRAATDCRNISRTDFESSYNNKELSAIGLYGPLKGRPDSLSVRRLLGRSALIECTTIE
jgi:hypothetical protein